MRAHASSSVQEIKAALLETCGTLASAVWTDAKRVEGKAIAVLMHLDGNLALLRVAFEAEHAAREATGGARAAAERYSLEVVEELRRMKEYLNMEEKAAFS